MANDAFPPNPLASVLATVQGTGRGPLPARRARSMQARAGAVLSPQARAGAVRSLQLRSGQVTATQARS